MFASQKSLAAMANEAGSPLGSSQATAGSGTRRNLVSSGLRVKCSNDIHINDFVFRQSVG